MFNMLFDNFYFLLVVLRGFYLKYDYAMESNSSIPGLACPQTIKREWLNQELNFDNIANAILTLFTMLTAEGWEK